MTPRAATIDNNPPGTEITIGADTALTTSSTPSTRPHTAGAAHRAFIVEVMGWQCGHLARPRLATGAEMELLNEDGITPDSLRHDIETLRQGFAQQETRHRSSRGRRPTMTQSSRCIMEAESGGQFEVRQTILGHLQRGVRDRARPGARQPVGAHAAQQIMQDIESGNTDINVIGIERRSVAVTPYKEAMMEMIGCAVTRNRAS